MSKSYFFRGVHLTDDEMDGILMGADASVFESVRNLHLRECAECRAKLAEMRGMLGVFREGVQAWELPASMARKDSEVLPPRFTQDQNDKKKKYGWVMIPAMGLAAMLAVGVMAPHWMHTLRAAETASVHVGSAPVAEAVAGTSIAPTSQKRDVGHPDSHLGAQAPADDVLMQQVQQQLDEDVPSSMAPLTALIQTEEPHQAARQLKEN